MIKELGIVVEKDQDSIWVETAVKSTCKTCAAKSNCGTSAVAEAFAGKSVINKVANSLNAQVGDQVEIGIPEESLIQGAFWIYLTPIFSALFFCLVTQYWLTEFMEINEGLVILSTFLGGYLGFVVARKKLSSSPSDKYLPQLLSIRPEIIPVKPVDS
ncbi:SoxR reducing system RseC family protein [Psychrosphaera haliotis]|uniref:Uncharacterized protein n=1 Tax=Psychrosphaera haliotis TaxID=555083 RepID=A0A6N8F7L6_9GAMM|nr:SoxR reducing system RseC family protein [Psychrosphaera haliotis]MUH72556.1 hypothetical protein [Psychrosphaera haliotis]